MKRTLERELKVLEIAEEEVNWTSESSVEYLVPLITLLSLVIEYFTLLASNSVY